MTEETKEPVYNFYMTYGTVVYEDPEGGDSLASATINAMVKEDSDIITVRTLANIQRALQLQLFKQHEAPPKTVNVVISNIMHLAKCTDSEMYDGQENQQ